VLTHANILANVEHVNYWMPYKEGTVFLHAAPIFHIADFPFMVAAPAFGICQVTIPKFSPQSFCETVERERVTHTVLVPTMINLLTQFPELKEYDLSSLKGLAYGGSPMAPEGQEVAAGQTGELVARGANVMRGYWNNPEETALAFRNGLFRTGDVGYQDAKGYFYIKDRLKDMIVFRNRATEKRLRQDTQEGFARAFLGATGFMQVTRSRFFKFKNWRRCVKHQHLNRT